MKTITMPDGQDLPLPEGNDRFVEQDGDLFFIDAEGKWCNVLRLRGNRLRDMCNEAECWFRREIVRLDRDEQRLRYEEKYTEATTAWVDKIKAMQNAQAWADWRDGR